MIKTLPKSFGMKYREIPYFYNDEWITNACFAIKRNCLKDSHKYCVHLKDFHQPDIERVIPESIEGFIKIEKTKRLYEMANCYARVFVDSDNNEYFLNDEYVKALKVDTLYTLGINSIACNEDISIVIMQIRCLK